MKVCALVPIRSGSKSIAHKNIKLIAGKPLFYWSIAAAVESGIFSEVIISSDSQDYLDLVSKYFPQVTLDLRPAELAQDTTSTEAVMLHIADRYEMDVMSLIQVTSPLVSAGDFKEAYAKFQSEGLDSLLTAVPFARFIWSKDGHALNYDYQKRPRRQDFQNQLVENGAFYFTKIEILKNSKNRLGGKIGIHEMPEDTYLEIDEPSDWQAIEKMLSKKTFDKSQIKAVLIDVDGTLTDGGMYYSAKGEELKKFNTKDAHGMGLLSRAGYLVMVITAEDSDVVHARMRKLNIEHYFYGVKTKVPVVETWLKGQGLTWEQVAYVGDDLGDLKCLQKAGLAFCPADANCAVKDICHKISQFRGGEGAVRELCDWLLSGQA